MSDILERLRRGTGDGLRAWDWMQEAADEIERLIDAMEAAQECIDSDDVIGAYDVLTKAINGKNLDD